MKVQRIRGIFLVSLLTLAGIGHGAQAQKSKAADAIRAADQQWEKAAAAKDLDKTVSFCLPDGSVLPPNAPIATGSAAIRKVFAGYFGLPKMSLTWTAVDAGAATSGDLGYSRGTYRLSFTDASGKPVVDTGKYVTVWHKQADGSWKVLADIFNSDLPAK